MDIRLHSFFRTLQEGAADAGGSLEINMVWTREENPVKITKSLKKGMAIENLEGPDATPYQAKTGFLLDYFNLYYPVMGISQPVEFLEGLQKASQSPAPRLVISIGDRYNKDLYFKIYEKYRGAGITDEVSKLLFLKEVAAELAGEENADDLLKLWLSLGEVKQYGNILNTGDIFLPMVV